MPTNDNLIPVKLAIVGMDACFGPWKGLSAFAQAIFEGRQAFQPDSTSGIPGPVTGQIEIDLVELALSPEEFDRLTPAQIITLQTCCGALKSAGLSLDYDLPRTGVIAASFPASVDLAQMVSTHWDLSGPTITLDGGTEWISAGLDHAAAWFAAGQAEVVLLIGTNGAAQSGLGGKNGSAEPAALADTSQNRNKIAAYGSAVILVKALERAQADGDRIYSIVEGWAASGYLPDRDNGFSPGDTIRSAFSTAGKSVTDAELVGTPVLTQTPLGNRILTADLETFHSNTDPSSCALVSASAHLGDAGAASGLANLIAASLALYHRLIPGVPGWQGSTDLEGWQASSFYVPCQSRPWFVKPGQGERLAGVDLTGPDGCFSHVVLSRSEDQGERANRFLSLANTRLFPIGGASLEDLLAGLDSLQSAVDQDRPIDEIARQAFQKYSGGDSPALALALIAGSPEELQREIDFARKGLPRAFERGAEWQTPLGSYFTPNPVGKDGGVAFVYPGAFNSFIGLGKDLFQLFPTIYPRFARISQDIGHVIRERSLYPRTLHPLDQKELDELEARLSQDPFAMLTSGTSLAVLYTQVLRHVFGVHPTAAFGYSLGETSMLYALDVWTDGDAGSRGLTESPIFHRRLSGPKETVREAWQIPPADPSTAEEPLWSNLLLMASPDTVRQAMQGELRVYLTHINTPRQVVIAGDPAAVKRVAVKIGCPALQAPFDHVLHCDPVRLDFDGLAGLHDYPVQPNSETALYSAAGYSPIGFEQKEIARDIAETLCSSLDFPRLVERVYTDGARIFVEAGAGSNCSRWVDEVLKGKPHLAVSVSRKGSDDLSALLRTLARLVSHRVCLDLSPLFATSYTETAPASLVRTVNLAG
ncbi:MAG TPA: PfaB family protein [Anaerolineaceae bacterium]